jgi:hypothetical protein
MDRQDKTYRLGPLPWSRETLIKAYWGNWLAAYEYIKEHSGFTAQEQLQAIQFAFHVFLDNTDDLLSAIEAFKQDFQKPGFSGRGNRANVEHWDRKLRKHFFSVATSAFALVDAYRRVTQNFSVAEYEERKQRYFLENELHHFMQGLRNFFSHRRILTPSWLWSKSAHQERTQLVVRQKDLLEFDNWDTAAKAFIQKHTMGVDIEVLTSEYRRTVNEFYTWFRDGFQGAYGDEIQEYVAYRNVLEGEEWKQFWRNLLNYGIEHKLNPYDYLREHLTPEEMEQVVALPHGSREQVDMIIAKADEFGICDAEIRSKVYQLFGVRDE